MFLLARKRNFPIQPLQSLVDRRVIRFEVYGLDWKALGMDAAAFCGLHIVPNSTSCFFPAPRLLLPLYLQCAAARSPAYPIAACLWPAPVQPLLYRS